MLEHRSLLLLADPSGVAGNVTIVDLETGLTVGGARRSPPRKLLGWLPWWTRPTLTVHESGDEPLLCVIERGIMCWTSWRVREAEGSPVGRVTPTKLFGLRDAPLAEVLAGSKAETLHFHSPQGEELACCYADRGGIVLKFAADAHNNPFIRMVMLAAALLQVLKSPHQGAHGVYSGANSP